MRYLKYFESNYIEFNSTRLPFTDIKSECEDILQELKDTGLFITIKSRVDIYPGINVYIDNTEPSGERINKTPFKYSDVKVNVEHLVSFMEDNGFTLNYSFGKYGATAKGFRYKDGVYLKFKTLEDVTDDEIDAMEIIFLAIERIPKQLLTK